MNYELKAMACLLVYPNEQLAAELEEIEASILASPYLNHTVKESFSSFIKGLKEAPLTELQKKYVVTFDVGRKASLNLFEHLHGDSRGRGPAMISLKKLYEDHGLEFESEELPDFLPAVLEFLSGVSFIEAQIWLQSAAPLIASIDKELQLMKSPWRTVTAGLLAMAGSPTENVKLKLDDLVPSIDAEWKDQPVQFGSSSNPVEQQIYLHPYHPKKDRS